MLEIIVDVLSMSTIAMNCIIHIDRLWWRIQMNFRWFFMFCADIVYISNRTNYFNDFFLRKASDLFLKRQSISAIDALTVSKIKNESLVLRVVVNQSKCRSALKLIPIIDLWFFNRIFFRCRIEKSRFDNLSREICNFFSGESPSTYFSHVRANNTKIYTGGKLWDHLSYLRRCLRKSNVQIDCPDTT